MVFQLQDSWVWDFWLADDGSTFHLYYLHASKSLGDPELRHRNARIGHATSADLLTWTRHGTVLEPGDPNAFDADATWTGSVIQGPDGLWRMFYTGARYHRERNVQAIGVATSPDLWTWTKQPETVIEADPQWYERLGDSAWPEQAWRDPWVLADPDGDGWHMLLTARAATGELDERGVIGHARSADLTSWRVCPPLSAPGSGFAHLEVPQVASVDGRDVLIFSCGDDKLPAARAASHPGGGIWSLPVSRETGPYDVARASILTPDPLYSARLVRDRSGRSVMLACLDALADGTFDGVISDPFPVAWGADGQGLSDHHDQAGPSEGDHPLQDKQDRQLTVDTTDLRTDTWWFTRPDGDRGALGPRAQFPSDRPELSLSGDWDFRWFPTAAQAAREAPDPAASSTIAGAEDSWPEKISVPGHWVLEHLDDDRRFGAPWYTNTRYPFPVDPPHVPDANPTGDYRTTFQLDDLVGAADRDELSGILLRFEGVESAFRVWVNGQWAGQAMGSRLTHEFDVTDLVRAGINAVVVRVHQFSAGSYVEDQDQWWLPGIFRDVRLIGEPRRGIRDIHVRADRDPATGEGTVSCQVTAPSDAFPVLMEIPELGFSAQIPGPEAVELPVGPVRAWTAEDPQLYEVILRAPGHTVYERTGFRRVEITADGVLRVDGAPVRFRGVNRHEFHPRRGRAVDAEFTRREYQLMLDHHINAVRTSHYPPAAHALELADEMGLWIVLEGDIETHGFVHQGWRDNPSDDPAWHGVYLDRTARMWHRDKNRPSVVMLSLGNEAGTGSNLRAAAQWLRERDARPVHYEGDHDARYTDVYSRMYPTPSESRRIAAGQPVPSADAAGAQRIASMPFILCEYAHAMGTGPGGLGDFEAIFREHPRACGGFVWEWKDHGITVIGAGGTDDVGRVDDAGSADSTSGPGQIDGAGCPGGTPMVAYGGDFGEPLHDGNFVLDGLCTADGAPTPGLAEYAAVIDPLRVELSPGWVTVGNGHDHTTLHQVRLSWAVRTVGQAAPTGTGSAVINDLTPGACATVEIPAESGHGEYLEVTVQARGPAARPLTRTVQRVGAAAVFDRTGAASSSQQPGTAPAGVSEPELSVFRAPTDNDAGVLEPTRELWMSAPDADPVDWHAYTGTDLRDATDIPGVVISTAQRWLDAGLHRLQARPVPAPGEAAPGTVRTLWAAPGATAPNHTLVMDHRWTAADTFTRDAAADTESAGSEPIRTESAVAAGSETWRLDIAWELPEVPFPLPRVGCVLRLPVDPAGVVEFEGDGPLPCYPDARAAALLGTYRLPASALAVPGARPQSSGNRSRLHRLSIPLTDGTRFSLRTINAELNGEPARYGVNWTLTPYADAELMAAAHPHELPDVTAHDWFLHLDVGHHGLGSRSCGTDVAPQAQLHARTGRLEVVMGAGE